MSPWLWLDMLTIAVAVHVAVRRRWGAWLIAAAAVGGLALAGLLQTALTAAMGALTGDVVNAGATAVQSPLEFFTGLLVVVVGALNPEPWTTRVLQDVVGGGAPGGLGRLRIGLLVLVMFAMVAVPVAAATRAKPLVRGVVVAGGALAIALARLAADYAHYKDRGIVVVRADPHWLIAVTDFNWVIVGFLQAFIQLGVIYGIVRAVLHLARKVGARSHS